MTPPLIFAYFILYYKSAIYNNGWVEILFRKGGLLGETGIIIV